MELLGAHLGAPLHRPASTARSRRRGDRMNLSQRVNRRGESPFRVIQDRAEPVAGRARSAIRRKRPTTLSRPHVAKGQEEICTSLIPTLEDADSSGVMAGAYSSRTTI